MTTVHRLKQLYEYNPESGLFTATSSRKQWSAGRVAGCKDKYTMIYIDGKRYRAHRLAWLYMTGSFPNGQIDHLNGDKHDNRYCNLRIATPAENSQNIWKVRSDCVSGFKGVSWRERNKKWHATIRLDGRSKHLGYFGTAEEAHHAYVAAKQEHHSVARSI